MIFKHPIVVFAIVLVIATSFMASADNLKGASKIVEVPSDLNEGYAERIQEIIDRGDLTDSDIAEIQDLLSLAERHEIHPEDWQSPPTTVIEQGSGVETASYIIFLDSDGVAYAKSGDNGEIMYSGDNATVINNTLNALTSGRTWRERVVIKGDFEISSTIEIPSYTILDLTGAKLKLADGTNDNMIQFVNGGQSTPRYIDIIGGILDGNKTNNTAGSGITDNGAAYSLTCNLYDVKITSFEEDGIKLYQWAVSWVERCEIISNDGNGIYVSNMDRLELAFNEIYYNSENGIRISGSHLVDIGSKISANDKHGISGTGLIQASFIGTWLGNNDHDNTGTYHNIYILQNNNRFIGVTTYTEYLPPYPSYDYYETSGDDNANQVVGCRFEGSRNGIYTLDNSRFEGTYVRNYPSPSGPWTFVYPYAKEIFLKAVSGHVAAGTATNLGNYGVVRGIENENEPKVFFTMKVPDDFGEFVSIEAVWSCVSPSGNMRWNFNSNYGPSGGLYNENSDTPSFGVTATGGENILNVQEAANPQTLENLTAGDYLGILFDRRGSEGADTLDNYVYLYGIRFAYRATRW